MQRSSIQTYSRRKFLSMGLLGGTFPAIPDQRAATGTTPGIPVSTDASEELVFMSAVKLAGLIRKKKVSSEELVKAYIDRIEDVNYHLNAVVMQCFDRALREAKAADQALSKGKLLGLL